MSEYRVVGVGKDATNGVGPAVIQAASTQETKERFAAREGTTLEAMQQNLTVIAEEITE